MTKQLEVTAREFESWRNSRAKRTHTPESLKTRAVALRQQYDDGQISKELGISKNALTRWANESKPDTAETFIELPIEMPAITTATENGTKSSERQSTLNITLLSGASLSLSGGAHTLADFVIQLSQRGAL